MGKRREERERGRIAAAARRKRTARRRWLALAAGAVLAAWPSTAIQAADYTVLTAADSGADSLRQVIAAANAYLERGLLLSHRGWTAQPYAALQYVYQRQDDVRERGAGLLNLTVDGLDVHSLRGILGGRWSRPFSTSRGRRLTPELRAAWLHEFLETEQTARAGLAPLGGSRFAVSGVDLGRDWVTLGGGVNLQWTSAARLFAGYDIQFNQYQTFHVGSGGLEITW